MDIKEKDLEEIIYNTETRLLRDRGLDVCGLCYRQPEIGSYGIADLIYISKQYDILFDDISNSYKSFPYLLINVCELKKEKAGISAFLQAVRYCKGISRYLKERGFFNYKLSITLIAPKIDLQSDYIFIGDLIHGNQNASLISVNNYSVEYGFDGIKFRSHKWYSATDEKFKTLKK